MKRWIERNFDDLLLLGGCLFVVCIGVAWNCRTRVADPNQIKHARWQGQCDAMAEVRRMIEDKRVYLAPLRVLTPGTTVSNCVFVSFDPNQAPLWIDANDVKVDLIWSYSDYDR